jgi:hypothetical protein
MSEKKKQHFVPRFYLKIFSNHGNNRSIGLWNIPGQKYVKEANIKGQAYGIFFYGKDLVIEGGLEILDTGASVIFKKIMALKALPPPGTEMDLGLRVYIMLQAERTKQAADETDEMFDKVYKAIFSKDSRFKDSLKDVRIGIEQPAAFHLSMAARLVPLTYDLAIKLVCNCTEREFITSDNPAAKYNQFLEGRNWPGGHFGWSVPGIQLFFPLSPRLYIIMYDGLVYKIGDRAQRVIELNNIKDVESLNSLQFLNAKENLYFGSGIQEHYIREMHKQNLNRRRAQRVAVRQYKQISPKPRGERYLLAMGRRDIRMKLSLSFCKLTKQAKRRDLGNKAAVARSPKIQKLVDLMEEADKQESRRTPE